MGPQPTTTSLHRCNHFPPHWCTGGNGSILVPISRDPPPPAFPLPMRLPKRLVHANCPLSLYGNPPSPPSLLHAPHTHETPVCMVKRGVQLCAIVSTVCAWPHAWLLNGLWCTLCPEVSFQYSPDLSSAQETYRLQRIPMMLICGHSLCQECNELLTTKATGAEFECPTCRVMTSKVAGTVNQPLQTAIAKIMEIKQAQPKT